MISAKLIAVTKPVVEGIEDAKELIAYCARVSNPANQMNMATADKLLAYLKKNRHWSPLEMANAVVEVNSPRDIARQLLRHGSFKFQEFSQRYADVTMLEEAFCIRELRMQDTKNRQNSVHTDDEELAKWWHDEQEKLLARVKTLYSQALNKGIAKEVARVVLPEGMTMSRVYVNGTIRSWVHYLEVRLEEGVTQWEHVMLARIIAEAVNAAFPCVEESWKAVDNAQQPA
jgi:thymidylate synthase (FAD)